MIAEIQPDVIGLQEVIRAEGAADADQPAYLASKLSMTVIMGVTRPIGSGSFGNAILTRLPVIASTTHDLSHGGYERRGCLRADLAADGAIVHVLNDSRPAAVFPAILLADLGATKTHRRPHVSDENRSPRRSSRLPN